MRLRRWLPALLLGGLLATFLNGIVVGYGVLWFQLFGEQPDREDYLVSFGGYAAAALVMLVGMAALRRLGAAEWVRALVVVLAVLLALLAVGSLTTGLSMEESSPMQHWWDGAGGVVLLPWAWLPLALGALALVGRGPRAPRTPDQAR